MAKPAYRIELGLHNKICGSVYMSAKGLGTRFRYRHVYQYTSSPSNNEKGWSGI